MPENPEKVDRIVRTQRGPGILYYQLGTDEAQLITFNVDLGNNKATPEHQSKARYGHEFVEAHESRRIIDDKTNDLIQQQIDAGQGIPGVQPGHTPDNPGHVVNQPMWQKLGFKNEDKWRRAGSPTE